MLAENTFRFLNETRKVATSAGWNDPEVEKLWLYNLHYFDDLTSANAVERKDWHRNLIERWIAENPAGVGNGWEPYTISLRIVNWIKWSLAGGELSEKARASLVVQVRFLSERLECHLLGNHLLANAKALVFAGAFFEGDEANQWLASGRKILHSELPEQVLADGGHFELSPMYHSVILEDLLDMENIFRTYAFEPVAPPELADRMRRWLATMCHPDGEISFFNDAAMGIATHPATLEAYALRLGHAELSVTVGNVHHLAASGYIRLEQPSAVLLIDVAEIGPSYLPGHGHADALSFELSLFGQRFMINSGTSCYGNGADRQSQRGTAAHNTLVIERKDSSEIWGGFRVARRAHITSVSLEQAEVMTVRAAHDGYRRLPSKNDHRRSWALSADSLRIEDEVTGKFKEACAYFHLHPQIRVISEGRTDTVILMVLGTKRVSISVKGATLSVVEDSWHPHFGSSEPSHCLIATLEDSMMTTEIYWGEDV
jgi:uncharacterized heparinase superfamily protein